MVCFGDDVVYDQEVFGEVFFFDYVQFLCDLVVIFVIQLWVF